MKIARAVKQERRLEVCPVFGIKFGDQARRRGEAQLRPPIAHVNNWEAHRIILPRIIQIQMKSVSDQRFLLVRLGKNLSVACLGDAQVFLGIFVIGIKA